MIGFSLTLLRSWYIFLMERLSPTPSSTKLPRCVAAMAVLKQKRLFTTFSPLAVGTSTSSAQYLEFASNFSLGVSTTPKLLSTNSNCLSSFHEIRVAPLSLQMPLSHVNSTLSFVNFSASTGSEKRSTNGVFKDKFCWPSYGKL